VRTSLLISTLLVQTRLLLPATAAEARRVPIPVASQPSAPQSVRIIKIVNASPEKVSVMLYDIYPNSGWRFVPDERTKSLFISGPGDPPPAMLNSIKEADSPSSPSPEGAVRVYNLKNANPEDICRVLSSLSQDKQFRCSSDSKSSRLIIRANEADWGTLTKLIEQMDVHRGQSEAPVLRVIPLKRQLSDDLLKELLGVIGVKDVKIAFDRENNSLIASGAPDATERLQQLLMKLDQTFGAAAHTNAEKDATDKTEAFRIRLAWLTSGPGGDVPSDLKPVVEELTKIGTNVPSLVTQTVVQTNTGNASLIARPANIELRLECQKSKAKGMYNINLQAFLLKPRESSSKLPGPQPAAPQPEIVNIRTELQVPFDHPIVLAVTPTQENETSAFVLEFLAAK
jgi:hypothetical protein